MTQPSTRHVFMSYSRRDEIVMRRVVTFLRKQGLNVWVDNERLKPGTPAWEAEIELAIPESYAIVVLLSPDAKNSEWVRREITLADQNSIKIYPVLIKGNENNAIFLRLIASQYIDLREDKEEAGLHSLFAEISSYIKQKDREDAIKEKAEREIIEKDTREKVKHETAEKAAREKAKREAAEKIATEKAESERKAREDAERVAKQNADKERIAKARIEAERLKKEEAEAERKTRDVAISKKVEQEKKQTPNRQKSDRRTWSIIGTIMVSIILIAIATSSLSNKPDDCSQPDVFCVGLVTDIGKINDNSYNQYVWDGLKRAEAELGAKVNYIETVDFNDYDSNIATFTEENYDVIVTVNFNMGDATIKAARLYPGIKFIGVDQYQVESAPNFVDLSFPEENAGFLAGALAAMMSESHKIGAVCGTDVVHPVWRYSEGYRAGAAYTDGIKGIATDVIVMNHNDVGVDKTFVDTEWGAATANQIIDQGADVIYSCDSSLTGNAAISAAAGSGAYVIGTDVDQYYLLPETAPRLLTSATKLITPGVFDLIKLAKEGNFPTGNYLGAAGYAPFHDLENEVPADVKLELEQINAGLLDGSIKTNVPTVKP